MKFYFILCILISMSVHAEEDLTLKSKVVPDKNLKLGWTNKMSASANISLNSSENVVGQTDGSSQKYEGKIEGKFYYKNNREEYRQDVKYVGATTQTPSLPSFVKSDDKFTYEFLYLKSLESRPNLGPYGKLSLSTPFFKGEDVQAEAKTYVNTTTTDNYGVKNSHLLTDAFKPLTLKAAVGLFAKVIERENTKFEVRAGLGAQSIYAKNQLIVKDDEATANIIELEQLDDFDQVGVEYGFLYSGKWNENSDYTVKADFLSPVGKKIEAGKQCADCSEFELTNIDFTFAFGTKLNSWAKLTYEYKASKQPELLNQFQIQNGLVLAITYNVL